MSPRMSKLALVLAAGFSALTTATPAPRAPIISPRQTNETNQLTFADVKPSSEIDWVACYDGLQCTFLTVPLDYENIEAGTTDVAFTRYLISEDHEDLLFNPGGPGESGTEFVQGSGPVWAKRWGYNIVSFDPRGVKWTKPLLNCAPSNEPSKRRREVRTLGDLSEEWNTSLQSNTACSEFNADTDAKYAGTSAVVQDMMHFTELQAAARGKDPKTAQINYYGVSYGTLVGQTLVALYPDRLRRVLLDGNVYGTAHYQGWEPSGLDDFAHGIWLFTKLCFEAGEDYCPLAADATSIEEVYARFDAAVERLKVETIEYEEEQWNSVTFLGKIQSCMYGPRSSDPLKSFTAFSTYTLHALNATSVEVDPSKLLRRDGPAETSQQALAIITAIDIAGRYPFTEYEQWKAAADQLERTAPYGAQGYATSNGIIGLAANIIPPASQFFPGFEPVVPSTSVLFVNTVGDPVTPMSSARQMSKLFAGSGVLIVDGPGHGYSSAPSKCANAIIATYFENGTVPEGETWCNTDVEANYYFGGPIPDWVAE